MPQIRIDIEENLASGGSYNAGEFALDNNGLSIHIEEANPIEAIKFIQRCISIALNSLGQEPQ